ncbi:hypothetical protein [Pelagibacterium halotolerans]|uniref:Uncharacterized protein n=1 Tax=Pelagibacterium halotolerans (strain DSM 22347 / JCM 15775 / CGMCC 1.7692 / B2) TaxID=1082931 RepID=G4R9Q3_PELHB|nr:hypothetical protein [Pelagibacterium halotolerans]AEQ51460.1 hypothetical protein KKY_1440 [Pelagibacterium halotolerans B2]QJR18699.1 hypothetical protein HKM20_09770 [Pelagibacterium halotolerans]SEA14151.1 hypothetical protein SAMN05428936_10277 [Pelagibacterium halotolerans]
MNPVASRLKAIAVTAAFFALSGLALLGVIWGLAALPLTVPGGLALTAYRPHDTVSVLSDLRLPVALTAAFLVATAIVLLFSSAYLDKMIAIFADVLLMLMAALAGFVAGYWVLLRLAGYENFMRLDFLQAALVPPVVVFAVSLLSPSRLRSSWAIRIAAILALLIAAPLMLVNLP